MDVTRSPVHTLVYLGETFLVHEVVLRTKLPYFYRVVATMLRTSDAGRANFDPASPTAIFPLPAPALSALLDWAYTGRLDALWAARRDPAYWQQAAIIVGARDLEAALRQDRQWTRVQAVVTWAWAMVPTRSSPSDTAWAIRELVAFVAGVARCVNNVCVALMSVLPVLAWCVVFFRPMAIAAMIHNVTATLAEHELAVAKMRIDGRHGTLALLKDILGDYSDPAARSALYMYLAADLAEANRPTVAGFLCEVVDIPRLVVYALLEFAAQWLPTDAFDFSKLAVLEPMRLRLRVSNMTRTLIKEADDLRRMAPKP